MMQKFSFTMDTAIKIVAVVLAANVLLSFVLLKEISELRSDTQQQVSALKQSGLLLNEKAQKTELSLKNNVSSLDSTIKNLRGDFANMTSDLNALIVQIENQSSIQLGELRQQIQGVSESSADFSKIAQQALDSVVTISTDIGQGSGAIISENGLVVTNYHVIAGAKTIDVVFANGNTFQGSIVAQDSSSDIAIIKINSATQSFLEIGDSALLKPGQRVIAVGSPAGLRATVTEGIISALNRNIEGLGSGLIQIDVPVNPGNSGGPLVDAKGKLIGITTAKIKGAEGLGFAIPSNKILPLIPS